MDKYIEMKIGKMRKPQNFLIQRVNVNDERTDYVVQSGKSIGILNTESGVFKFTTEGCYFPHLALAKPMELPEELKNKIEAMAGAKI